MSVKVYGPSLQGKHINLPAYLKWQSEKSGGLVTFNRSIHCRSSISEVLAVLGSGRFCEFARQERWHLLL